MRYNKLLKSMLHQSYYIFHLQLSFCVIDNFGYNSLCNITRECPCQTSMSRKEDVIAHH